jgi:hypothetical protein
MDRIYLIIRASYAVYRDMNSNSHTGMLQSYLKRRTFMCPFVSFCPSHIRALYKILFLRSMCTSFGPCFKK